jgi:glycosyltransferase involved in cell wall biosynthesis
MITVCIPVYNSDVRALVEALYEQSKKINETIEIIVIDDGSRSEFKKWNSELVGKVNYFENQQNKGRARIRNQFLEHATQPFLLFIDGDSALISASFLENYLQEIKSKQIQVLCGASIYQKEKPQRNYFLRWKYSIERESKSIQERLKNPSLGFKTNNFLIRKTVFEKVKFNETLLGYGHEDTLFGFELAQSKIAIHHIDNSVLNKNLDDNTTFLTKTNEGLKSLLQVLKIVKHNEQFTQNIKLVLAYQRIKKYPILNFLLSISVISLPLLTYCLKKGFFTLRMFDLYKLIQFDKLGKRD